LLFAFYLFSKSHRAIAKQCGLSVYAVGQFQVQERTSCRVCKGEEPLLRFRKAECLRGVSGATAPEKMKQQTSNKTNKYNYKKSIFV